MRLELLEEANKIFTNLDNLGKSFYDLDENTKRNLAGFPLDKEYDETGLDWGWFGSMKGAGWYKNEILEGKTIAEAIDRISLSGDVTKSMFDEYCKAFYELDKENPLATATRLLAIKRPDLFLCIDSANKDFLCGELDITDRSLTLEKYWNSVHIRILNSSWFKDRSLIIDERESQIKRFQVAMLDCIYYDMANE